MCQLGSDFIMFNLKNYIGNDTVLADIPKLKFPPFLPKPSQKSGECSVECLGLLRYDIE